MPGLFDPDDPSVIEGDGLPLDMLAASPAAGAAAQPTNWRTLAPLLAALPLALKQGGRSGGAALLRGFERSRQQREGRQREDARAAEQRQRQEAQDTATREYRLATLDSQRDARAATRAAAEEAKRQQFFQQFVTGVDELDTPEAVQAYLALQRAKAAGLGIVDDLTTMVPPAAALSKRRAQKELEKLQKARPDDWQNWSVKVDGRDVPATELAGVVRNPAAPSAGPKTFGQPDFYRVGKSVLQLRQGSDGKMYDDSGNVVTGAQPYQAPSSAQPDQVLLISGDGKTQRYVAKSAANAFLDKGWKVFDQVAARQNNAPDTSDAKAITEDAVRLIDRLRDDPYLGAATGAYEMRGLIPGWRQGVIDLNAVRTQLVNMLALPNLGALKGPMSDKDVAFVKNISSRLENPNLSYEETVRALDEARLFLERKAGRPIPKQPQAGGPGGGGRHKVGDVVTVRGQRVKITAVNPDGTFEGEPAP